jgi:hypothetical protein
MLKIFLSVALVGFLLGIAAVPAFADPLDRSGETAALGAALGGSERPSLNEGATAVRQISDRDDMAKDCVTARCDADPENARRILGALLASMGTLATQPDTEPGLPVAAR